MSRTGDYGWGRLSKGSQRALESQRESAFHGPGIDLLAEKTVGAREEGKGPGESGTSEHCSVGLESWSELHFDSFKHSLNMDSLKSSHSAELWGFRVLGGDQDHGLWSRLPGLEVPLGAVWSQTGYLTSGLRLLYPCGGDSNYLQRVL